MRETGGPVLSGVGLIVVCFFASAALRLSGGGLALAQGVGEFAESAATPGDAMLRGDPGARVAARRGGEAARRAAADA